MKENVLRVIDILADGIKSSVSLFTKNISENSQEIVDNATGTVGILLKLFGKPVIDKYYEKKTIKKLENYGTETYIEAGRKQIAESMQKLNKNEELASSAENIIQIYEEIVNAYEEKKISENVFAIFQPQYHPSIEHLKEIHITLLAKLGFTLADIELFKKDFNQNIQQQVEKSFGNDYEKHLEEIKEYVREESEIELLVSIIKSAKIGFEISETLNYEETFAKWESIYELTKRNSDSEYSEKNLRPVRELIDEYFSDTAISTIEKILFIIADFGKGKSVFMKHHAFQYAKEYLNTGDGYFPIYFNLREYNKYRTDEKLGVIANFLSKKYGFDIANNKNRHKKYLFLIDSLDESGELNPQNIIEVIDSIKRIQNLDPIFSRENRIIIASRPIDRIISNQIEKHNPHYIDGIAQCISIFGFKKEQFNSWISSAIKQANRKVEANDITLITEILEIIYGNKKGSVYQYLTKDSILSQSELQRPIFAYMIYQLIMKNIDFLKVGKIGIYLSFINLLSKEAKHVNDKNIKIDLDKEYEFRNLLHITAAIWQLERHKGNQGFLKKADICRVLESANRNSSDKELLDKYSEIRDVQFLSHSYFGEDNNTLYFQHQSFAEILLAEYYLKVIICYALEINSNKQECSARLLLGNPTWQTKWFIKDLVELIKETASENITDDVIEKRKLLFPFFAALSTQKNNTLFSNHLYYKWFLSGNQGDKTKVYTNLLENWCVGKDEVQKILHFCSDIINSSDNYLLAKGESKTNLLNDEVFVIQNTYNVDSIRYFEKWIASLIGNTLYNDISDKSSPRLYNRDYKINPHKILDICKYYTSLELGMISKLFMGIQILNKNVNSPFYIEEPLENCNFSFSHLENVAFLNMVASSDFDYAILNNVTFNDEFCVNSLLGTELNNVGFNKSVVANFSEAKLLSNIDIKVYSDIVFHNMSNLMKYSTKKFLQKYGKIYMPYHLVRDKKNIEVMQGGYYTEPYEVNQVINFIKTFGKLSNKKNKFYTTELKEILLFPNDDIEGKFYEALIKDIPFEDLI
ncbi:MAG: NACHT domain-containing protein [Dysgonomonas sp.]